MKLINIFLHYKYVQTKYNNFLAYVDKNHGLSNE